MYDPIIYIALACILGLFMTWGIGANDLANVLSPAMGSRALTVRQALIIAIIFEISGAVFGGSQVVQTVRNGIINPEVLMQAPWVLVHGMLSVLLAGSTWMLLASVWGMPVSITNAIVGSLVGFGVLVFGPQEIYWQKVGYIAISWLACPTIAGVLSYTLFRSIQRLILEMDHPARYVTRYIPLYLFLAGLILSNMIVIKGLRKFSVNFDHISHLKLAVCGGLLVAFMGTLYIKRLDLNTRANLREQFLYVEKAFAVLVVLTSCAMVFAHGSNDVSIAVGPIAAVINIVQGVYTKQAALPIWIVILASMGVVMGLMFHGRKVIETVGSDITMLTPSRAYAAMLAASSTVIVSTGTGLPVSATQTLVGAILGVGLARGIGALNILVIRNIFMSWIVTLPAASLLAMTYFQMFKLIFSKQYG